MSIHSSAISSIYIVIIMKMLDNDPIIIRRKLKGQVGGVEWRTQSMQVHEVDPKMI